MRRLTRHGWLAACIAAVAGVMPAAARATEAAVTGAELSLVRPDGAVLADDGLVGQVFVYSRGASSLTLRVEAVDRSADDPDVPLYTFSRRLPDGHWTPLCEPGIDGTRRAVVLAGYWTADGRHLEAAGRYSLSCTSGAIAKCVLWGYGPWRGELMWRTHQACVRMMRADYCGDGQSHTRDGTFIRFGDVAGVHALSQTLKERFEAAWGADGATCVARTRLADVLDADRLAQLCPQRLAARIGAACTPEAAERLDGTLILNGS